MTNIVKQLVYLLIGYLPAGGHRSEGVSRGNQDSILRKPSARSFDEEPNNRSQPVQ
jgi:hypothetical protein